MPIASLHPVLRYTSFLLPIVIAGGLLRLSFWAAPASMPWLVAAFVSVGLFIAAQRLPSSTELRRPFMAYSGVWFVYLVNVWYLHVDVPGDDLTASQTRVDMVARAVALGAICVPVVIYSFALRISRLRRAFFRWIEWGGWALAAFFSLASLSGNFAEDWYWSGTVWVPTTDGLYGHFALFAPIYVLLGWCVALVRVFTAPSRRWRLQLMYYLIGFVPFSLACLSHLLISSGKQVYPFGGWLFILHFAIIAYAVWVHRLYDVTLILRRSLAYALVSLAMGLLYAGALWVSTMLAESNESGGWSALLFVLAAGLLITPLLAHTQRWVDRVFARDEANRRRALEGFSSKMATCLREDDVCDPLCRVLLDSLKTRAVWLFLMSESGALQLAGYATARTSSPAAGSEALEHLQRHLATSSPATTSVDLAPNREDRSGAVQVTEGCDHLLVPVRHRERLLGGLIVEPKIADDPFFADDRRFAEAAAAQASVALVNARSFARIRQLQELTRQTMDGMTAGVMLVSGDGRIVLANPASRSLLGFAGCAEDGSRRLPELREQQPGLVEWLGDCLLKNEDRLNSELQLAGGEPKFLLGSAHPLTEADDGTRLMLFLLHDVTEYKSMEERLRRQEYLARTGTMIAAINHEIGNILQPIQTQVRKLVGLPEAEPPQRSTVERLQDRTAALDRLLRNLKDFARPIELRIRDVDVRELAQEVIRDLPEQHSDGVAFEVQIGSEAKTCRGDGYWLRQVLYNLVRNAVEATSGREDRRVCVTTEETDASLALKVKDNGAGIAPAVRKKLFEPFASTKAETGTGLGLSLCRKIVDLHGGNMSAESEPEKGTTFTVSLPTAAPQNRAPLSAAPHSKDE